MKVGILGPGAMGTLYTAFLSRRGCTGEIYLFDYKPERAKILVRNGLVITGRSKIRVLPSNLNVIIPEHKNIMGKLDLLIVLVKTYDTVSAVRNLQRFVDNSTVVLTLQNGLGNYELLKKCFGSNALILAGVTTIGATLLSPGKVRHAGEGVTVIGYNNKHEHKAGVMVARLFRKAGLKVDLTDNIQSVQWGKLVINAGINPVAAIMNLSNGRVMENDTAWVLATSTAQEAAMVANKLGIRLPYPDITRQLIKVCRMTYENRNSMLVDYHDHRGKGGSKHKPRTEIDMINGMVVKYGKKAGIQTPVNGLWVDIFKRFISGMIVYGLVLYTPCVNGKSIKNNALSGVSLVGEGDPENSMLYNPARAVDAGKINLKLGNFGYENKESSSQTQITGDDIDQKTVSTILNTRTNLGLGIYGTCLPWIGYGIWVDELNVQSYETSYDKRYEVSVDTANVLVNNSAKKYEQRTMTDIVLGMGWKNLSAGVRISVAVPSDIQENYVNSGSSEFNSVMQSSSNVVQVYDTQIMDYDIITGMLWRIGSQKPSDDHSDAEVDLLLGYGAYESIREQKSEQVWGKDNVDIHNRDVFPLNLYTYTYSSVEVKLRMYAGERFTYAFTGAYAGSRQEQKSVYSIKGAHKIIENIADTGMLGFGMAYIPAGTLKLYFDLIGKVINSRGKGWTENDVQYYTAGSETYTGEIRLGSEVNIRKNLVLWLGLSSLGNTDYRNTATNTYRNLYISTVRTDFSVGTVITAGIGWEITNNVGLAYSLNNGTAHKFAVTYKF
ncbi:MAG: 2-dehydropantoate 2-reductase [Elusimicrobiota bacterium]